MYQTGKMVNCEEDIINSYQCRSFDIQRPNVPVPIYIEPVTIRRLPEKCVWQNVDHIYRTLTHIFILFGILMAIPLFLFLIFYLSLEVDYCLLFCFRCLIFFTIFFIRNHLLKFGIIIY